MSIIGENVAGYTTPVLNEREIRASAGILLLLISVSIMRVAFLEDFQLLKYFVIMFLGDFIIRVFVSPRFSPTLILGRLIVRNQVPEYVGAVQKRFVWIIGLLLSTIIFFLLVILNTHNFITGSICIVCLIFLFFESCFGICLGCLFYNFLYKERLKYCSGEICDVKVKHPIQEVSGIQIFVVFGFVVLIIITILLFNKNLTKRPNKESTIDIATESFEKSKILFADKLNL